ncbi:MAG: TRAP transporter substrate-binding protein DctP [Proteobacteria bacterium]|nr:TRAP transporter substrate-binding protein DctP [Pseudomonadota bacterium]
MHLLKSRPERLPERREAPLSDAIRPLPSRRSVMSGIALALAGGAPALWPAHAGAREFSAADIYPSGHPTVAAMGQLSEQMAIRTDGRHRVRRLPGQRAHTESYLISQVRNGSLDMARVDVASLASLVPMANLLALPYLFTSAEHRQRVFDGEIGALLMAQLDARALVGLCFYELGPRCFYGARPIRAASDLQGLSVRVPRSGPWVRMVSALGARPVAIPYDQIYLALKERTVDLAESNWQSFLTSRHNEVARYFSLTEHMLTPGIVIFSRRTWDMLAPDEQVALRDAARESEMYLRGIWNELRPSPEAAPAGVEIVTDIDRASFVEATAPLHQEQAATPQFQKMLKQIRDLAD